MTEVATQLQEVQESIADARINVTSQFENVELQVRELAAQASQRDGQIVPDEVEGTIENYQFGVSKEEHPNGIESMPTHRFDLNVGNQVWLHIVLGSDKWDTFVANSGLTEEDMEGKETGQIFNGKRIKVRRDAAYGRYVPVEMAGQSKPGGGAELGTDSQGEPVFAGDRIEILSSGRILEVAEPEPGGAFEASYSPSVTGTSFFQGRPEDGDLAGGTGDTDPDTALPLIVVPADDTAKQLL